MFTKEIPRAYLYSFVVAKVGNKKLDEAPRNINQDTDASSGVCVRVLWRARKVDSA
jgi:hypothetical protein